MTVLDRDMNLELVRLQSRASLPISRHDPWKEAPRQDWLDWVTQRSALT